MRRPRTLRRAELLEEGAVGPHLGEAAPVAHAAGEELVVDDEGAGVDVTYGIDQADHPTAPQRLSPSSGSPRADRWKKESPVKTSGRSMSQW